MTGRELERAGLWAEVVSELVHRSHVVVGDGIASMLDDLVAPLGSQQFGQSTALQGGPYTTQSALRRILLQASFNF